MMTMLKRAWFVWVLLFCLVLVNGLMAAPSVAHAEHHGHHQAGTHASGICAWLCAAGQGVESSSVQLISQLRLLDYAEADLIDLTRAATALCPFFRGPPPVSR